MARPSANDPLDRFRWGVQIDGFTRLGFSACDVPSYQIQTKTYPEGGQHLAPLQIVDSITYKPVTLTRGVTADKSFDGWARQFIELVNGKTTTVVTQINHPGGSIPELGINLGGPQTQDVANDYPVGYRRTVVITHQNRVGQPVKVYTLYNAFPIQYEPASTFSADGDDVLSMEKLVLAYESFDVKSISEDSNPFDVRDIIKRLTSRNI